MPILAPLRAACALTLFALGATALPAHADPDGRRQFDSGPLLAKRVITNTIPLRTRSIDFVAVPGGSTRVRVPANTTVLSKVKVSGP